MTYPKFKEYTNSELLEIAADLIDLGWHDNARYVLNTVKERNATT